MSISLFKIPTNQSDSTAIRRTLLGLLATQNANKAPNYLVITNAPSEILEAAGELGMLDTGSQWLFLLSTNRTRVGSARRHMNVSQLVRQVREGGNVAIALNATATGEECSVNSRE